MVINRLITYNFADKIMKITPEQMTQLKEYSELYWHIAKLQQISGARITEILNITLDDIGNNNVIYINGLKNSNDYTIVYNEVERIKILSCCYGGKLFGNLNYTSVYRAYLKFNIKGSKKGNKRAVVTHIFRNIIAKEFHQKFKNENKTKTILHHKSKKSQINYLK